MCGVRLQLDGKRSQMGWENATEQSWIPSLNGREWVCVCVCVHVRVFLLRTNYGITSFAGANQSPSCDMRGASLHLITKINSLAAWKPPSQGLH